MLSIRHLRDVDAGPVGSDLGPSLVRRGADRSVAIFGVVLGAALGLMVIPVAPDWATPGLLDRPRDLGAAIMAAAGLAVVAAGFVKIGLDRGAYVDVCERGVRRVRRGRESVVRLEDVEELIYEQARRYANGAYADSREVLTLRPGDRGRPITLKRRWRETTGFATDYVESTPMRRASERIARAIGARMAVRLERGESVDWTPRMRLVPGGLEVAWRPWLERTPFELVRALVSPRAWLDRWRRPWTRLAWDEVDRVEVERGIFSLRARGWRRPCVEVPTGSPNFFPGLLAAAPGLARDLMPSAPPDDRPATLTVRFTPTADDHVGLYRDLVRSTPLGRRDLWRRTLGRTAVLAGIAVMICLSMRDDGLIDDRSLPTVLAAVALVASVVAAMFFVGVRRGDRKRIVREVEEAHRRALRDGGIDPLGEVEVAFGPSGYALTNPRGRSRHAWEEVSRVDWFEGAVVVYLAGDKLGGESVDLMIPPRAWNGENDALAAFDAIQYWHARARDQTDSTSS